MHRTLAPLDMIFLGKESVVAIEAEVPPCQALPCPSYGPEQPIDAVVELGAGQAKVLGIRIGSPARIETIPSPGQRARSIRPHQAVPRRLWPLFFPLNTSTGLSGDSRVPSASGAPRQA